MAGLFLIRFPNIETLLNPLEQFSNRTQNIVPSVKFSDTMYPLYHALPNSNKKASVEVFDSGTTNTMDSTTAFTEIFSFWNTPSTNSYLGKPISKVFVDAFSIVFDKYNQALCLSELVKEPHNTVPDNILLDIILPMEISDGGSIELIFGSESALLSYYTLVSIFLIFFVTAALTSINILCLAGNISLESLNAAVAELTDSTIRGSDKRQISTVVSVILTLLVSQNVYGLLPHSPALTSQLAFCFLIASVVLSLWNFVGVYKNGVETLNLFFPAGAPLLLIPLIVPIEYVSYCFRSISLSVRLFANMMAGHTLFKVIAGFSFSMAKSNGFISIASILPFLVIVVLMFLEVAVAFIQTYVFFVLTLMYLSDAAGI